MYCGNPLVRLQAIPGPNGLREIPNAAGRRAEHEGWCRSRDLNPDNLAGARP